MEKEIMPNPAATPRSVIVASNFKTLRKRKGLTQENVASATGVKRPTYSGYENCVAEPSIANLELFAQFYGVSIELLLTKDLASFSDEDFANLTQTEDDHVSGRNLRILHSTTNLDAEENIELVTSKASAGYTNGYGDAEFIQALPSFRLPFLKEDRKYRAFQIKGDSMLPIPSGSWVTAEYVQDWRTIKTGTACIVVTETEGIVFKIIENDLLTKRSLGLRSLNPDYSLYAVPAQNVKEVWKFVNYIASEMPEPAIQSDELLQTVLTLRREMDNVKKRLR